MAVVNSFAKFYGASYPSEPNVLSTAPVYGDAINVLQGTASGGGVCGGYPPVADVLSGVVYGNASEHLGTLDVDASANAPDVSKVRLGVTYGSTNQLTGTSVMPVISTVLQGTGYGASGTEYVGTLEVSGSPTPIYPSVESVLLGIQFGNVGDVPMIGVYEKADPSVVKLDETYGAFGTQFYGDYECPDDPASCGESWLM
jgi:hypothetical protein